MTGVWFLLENFHGLLQLLLSSFFLLHSLPVSLSRFRASWFYLGRLKNFFRPAQSPQAVGIVSMLTALSFYPDFW